MTDKKYTPYITVKEKTDTQPAEFVELCTSPCDNGGAEVSVSNAPTTPIPISGSLTVTAGSINMTLGAELNALSAFSQNGIMVRTGTGAYIGRVISSGTGISVLNSSGVSGNPTIALGTVPINKLASYPNNANKVLYGDGAWRELNLPTNIATTTYVDDSIANHVVQINKLAGYPNNQYLVLKGNGAWGSIGSFFTSIDMNNNRITELKNPIYNTDAVNKSYVDNRIIPINKLSGYAEATNRSTSVLKADGTWSTISDIIVNLDMNNNRISNLANPSSLTDAVNQSYVVNRTIPISQLASYPNNSSYLLKGNGTWGTFTSNFTSYGSTYNIPVNNTYSSATETGFYIQQNGAMGLKIGHNSSTGRSYLKTRSNSTIEHYVGSQLSLKVWHTGIALNNGRIFEVGTPINSTDAATKGYVDSAVSGAGGSNPLDATEVNVNSVYTNWLRRAYRTRTNITIYGMNNSNGFIFENHNGESAGIAFSGSQDNCTIWTAGDRGYYLNIQDEDSSNSRKAYVSTSGSWVSVSSKERKYSIRDKNNNDILNRFMDVKVKTYGHKYDEGKFNKKKTERIARKSKEMATGLILEDLFKIFPNCISDYRNELFQKKDKKKKLSLEKEVKDIKNAGIDYNTLMCYFIMAFQEFVEKTNNKIKQLEAKND